MQSYHIHGLGARTWKTVLAVTICLIVSSLLNYIGILSLGFYAAVAALITMQSTIEKSWNVGKDRALGTVVGGILTVILLYIQATFFVGNYDTLFAIVGIIVSIFLCARMNIPLGISTAAIIILSGFVLYDITVIIPTITLRVLETIFGVVVALCINNLIKPPPPLPENEEGEK